MKKRIPQHPFALLDPQRAKQYLEAHRKMIFGDSNKHIQYLTVLPVKVDYVPNASRFVAIYEMFFGSSKARRVVCLAHEKGERAGEHRALEALARQARDRKNFCIPKPFFYDGTYGVSFIEYVPGPALYDVVKRQKDIPLPVLRSLFSWIITLSTLKLTSIPNIQAHPDFQHLRQDLTIVARTHTQRAQKLTHIWHRWERRFLKEWKTMPHQLAQGDFPPANIRLPRSTRKVCVIDFGRLTMAPPFWDLAGLLSQIDTLTGRELSPRNIHRLQNKILAAWHRFVAPLGKNEREHIAWLKEYYDLAAIAHLIAWENTAHLKAHIDRLFGNLIKT